MHRSGMYYTWVLLPLQTLTFFFSILLKHFKELFSPARKPPVHLTVVSAAYAKPRDTGKYIFLPWFK